MNERMCTYRKSRRCMGGWDQRRAAKERDIRSDHGSRWQQKISRKWMVSSQRVAREENENEERILQPKKRGNIEK